MMDQTASGERLHIGFFGKRNAGKSSIVNAVTGQDLSVVSDVKGTTTDPVKKSMELLPLGPVVIIDTPGFDDEGELGELRVAKTKKILSKTDIAVLVTDASHDMDSSEKELISLFETKDLPYLVVYNKSDLISQRRDLKPNEVYASAKTGENIDEIKNKLGGFAEKLQNTKKFIGDIIEPGDVVILVIPIDKAAPKGRLIMPQQMAIRDILDSHAVAMVCQPEELKKTLGALESDPKIIITDSQVFGRVMKDTPENVMLTSFSILMARYKGELDALIKGAKRLEELKDGDKVLISEGCTHHRQCGDIGTEKMPAWIRSFTGSEPEYSFSSGNGFPEDVSQFRLIVHCGGCMLNEKEMKHRIKLAKAADVPIVNYGIAIAHMHGILNKSLEPFSEYLKN